MPWEMVSATNVDWLKIKGDLDSGGTFFRISKLHGFRRFIDATECADAHMTETHSVESTGLLFGYRQANLSSRLNKVLPDATKGFRQFVQSSKNYKPSDNQSMSPIAQT